MVVTTSMIFRYLKEHQSHSIVRHEVSSYSFSILRRNLRMIIKNLYEGDASAKEISDGLRTRLSEWLTVPVPFDAKMFESISILGEPSTIANRWGQDIRAAYEDSLKAITILNQSKNLIRCQIRSVIGDLRARNKRFKIYCHRLAQPHFESIMIAPQYEPIEEGCFIHTSKGYREAEPFDVLIKVGPLRSRGWGGVPDALLTAPRFETLILFVWSGCGDEQGFGLDPVAGSAIFGGVVTNISGSGKNDTSHGISWKSSVERTSDNQNENGAPLRDEDEFQVFQTMAKSRDNRAAILAQIDVEHGILFPAHGQILSFDPHANENEQIGRRLLGETLIQGMFLIFPLLGDVDLGALHAKDGKLSPIWKGRLIEELGKDRNGLCKRLSDGGIVLFGLYARVKEWCKAPTTVIPAPQQARHFEVLIKVLGLENEKSNTGQKQKFPWWQYAWSEIRHSRGEAIQDGRFGQEIVGEKVEELLNELRVAIGEKCKIENDFTIKIPPGGDIHGNFRFCEVTSVEDGFRAPESAFYSISELREFEQWRV
jgi:hypothetical protein